MNCNDFSESIGLFPALNIFHADADAVCSTLFLSFSGAEISIYTRMRRRKTSPATVLRCPKAPFSVIDDFFIDNPPKSGVALFLIAANARRKTNYGSPNERATDSESSRSVSRRVISVGWVTRSA